MFARKAGLILMSSLACAVVASAQSNLTSGAVRGVVKNRSGEPQAEAKVTLRNLETGFTRAAVTDAKGGYLLPLIPIGEYEIRVEHPGMQTGKNPRLRVSLGDATVQNFSLDRKEAGATVVVTAKASAVNTQEVSSSTTVGEALVDAVPLNGRNFTDLAQLTPGVNVNAQGYRTTVDGARGVQNNLMIDGAGFNSNFYGEQRGGTRIPFVFGVDSIRELQVITNAYDAELGNAAGGIINAVSKTGTNDFSGTISTQLRPSSWQAMYAPVPYDPDGVTNTTANRTPHNSEKEYAANFGGPIIPDVLHYFVNLDYVHNSLQSTPTVASGAVATVASGSTAAEVWNTWMTGPLAGVVTNNGNGQTAFQELTTPWTDDEKHLTFMFRLDWTINLEHHASLRFNSQTYTGKNDTWAGVEETNEAASNNSTLKFNSTSWVGELESTLGGNFLNVARLQLANEERPTIPNSTVMQLDLPGIKEGGYYIDPRNTTEKTWQLMDTATYLDGDWTLKAGIDWQWIEYLDQYYPDARGELSFSTWDAVNWWMGNGSPGVGTSSGFTPSLTYYQDYSASGGVVSFGERLFGQFFNASYTGLMDRRLTLSAGLRYTREMWTGNPNPNPALQGLDQMPDNGSLDPRFGFALDLFGDSRTVLRGGWGFFSNPNPGVNASNAFQNNGINLQAYKVTYSAEPGLWTGANPLSASSLLQNGSLVPLSYSQLQGLPAVTAQVDVVDPRAKEAQAHRATLELEHDLGDGFVGKVKATYSRTYHLQYWININMIQTGVGSSPSGFYNDGYQPNNNNFQATTGGYTGHATVDGRTVDLSAFGNVYLSKYDGVGIYKAISFELNRQSATGFAMASSLTLSSSRDNNSNENTSPGASACPPDPSDPLKLYRSDNDTPVRLVVAGKLPPLYQCYLSGTFKLTSGLPYSPYYYGGPDAQVNGDDLNNSYALGGRNSMRQPFNKSFDLALTRAFHLAGNTRLDLSIQLFNVFNWGNFVVGSSSPYYATEYAPQPGSAVYGSFGQQTNWLSATWNQPRQAQANIKFTF